MLMFFLSLMEHKRRYLEKCLEPNCVDFHCIEKNTKTILKLSFFNVLQKKECDTGLKRHEEVEKIIT